MKFLSFLRKNITRNPARTFLTFSGVAVALFVFSTILSLENGVERMIQKTGRKRVLVVFERYKACPPLSNLPIHYQNRIREVPGVEEVAPTLFLLSNCSSATDLVSVLGVEPKKFRKFRNISIPKTEYQTFASERSAAIIGEKVAKKYGWKVGDVVTLQKLGRISFTVRGIFEVPGSSLENTILVHLKYLQYSIDRIGQVTQFYVLLKDARQGKKVSEKINLLFQNEKTPTKTGPERSFISTAISDVRGLIDFSQLLAYLSIVIIFAGVANSIFMSMRDRTREIAILKTLGFRRRLILLLFLSESLLVCLVGGLVGTTLAYTIINHSTFVIALEGFSIAPYIGPGVFMMTIALSVVIGVLGAFIPAWYASHQNIVAGLRQVD